MEKKVIIIDDDKNILEIVAEILLGLFETVDLASSVLEATELLAKNQYSIIFLDINIKNRNGAEVVKFIIESSQNANKNVPIIILSGILTPQFVNYYQTRFAKILLKPFNHKELRAIAEELLKSNNENASHANSDYTPEFKCEFPFAIEKLEMRVNKVLNEVRKSARLKQYFSKIKVNRTSDNYISSHVGLIIDISTAICAQMEWRSDKTIEKFIYSAYLHDMALANRPDLARLNSLKDLESLKDKISPKDYKLVFEHPNIAYETIIDMAEIPQDVALIIKQHHEVSDGSGFPARCNYQKISILSAIFIIAHDFADYILSNPSWKIENYITIARMKFAGNNFTRVIKALSRI